MSSDPKDQKTAILQEAPPEVSKAAPEQKTMMASAPVVSQGGGMASGLPPPPAPPPPGGAPPPATPVSNQATVMLSAPPVAKGPERKAVVPTVMREGRGDTRPLPPVHRPRREAAWGRWIAGPLIAIVVAAGTAALARVVMPPKPKGPVVKPQGRLKVNSKPPAASVIVNGRTHPHFTPTVIEADVGATLHLVFKLDGYADKEADVYVAEGERAFAVALDKRGTPPAPAPDPAPSPSRKERRASPAPKEPAGKGTITVKVRPWAIVYVDGSRLRQTPINNFELPAGKHQIELVNDAKGRREIIQVDLKPGAAEELSRDWDQ